MVTWMHEWSVGDVQPALKFVSSRLSPGATAGFCVVSQLAGFCPLSQGMFLGLHECAQEAGPRAGIFFVSCSTARLRSCTHRSPEQAVKLRRTPSTLLHALGCPPFFYSNTEALIPRTSLERHASRTAPQTPATIVLRTFPHSQMPQPWVEGGEGLPGPRRPGRVQHPRLISSWTEVLELHWNAERGTGTS